MYNGILLNDNGVFILRPFTPPFKNNKIALARYGGLNLVKQKNNYGNDTFHSAPERYGMYAFIFPFIELFLIGSTKTKEYNEGTYKKFHAVDGYIWTHLSHPNVPIFDKKNAWYKIQVQDLPKVVRKTFAIDTGSHYSFTRFGYTNNKTNRNKINEQCEIRKAPYTLISKDHLEVFVCRETIIS